MKLTKAVLNKLSESEKKKLDRMMKMNDKLFNEMNEAQQKYSMEARKGNVSDEKLRKMADKGFRLEKKAFDHDDKLTAYKNDLMKKYKK